jgi:zinc protease
MALAAVSSAAQASGGAPVWPSVRAVVQAQAPATAQAWLSAHAVAGAQAPAAPQAPAMSQSPASLQAPAIPEAGVSAQGAAAARDVVRATLANGLRVIVIPDPVAPVATVEMTYLAGSANSPPGLPGTAHAQEHMALRSLADLTTPQLGEILGLLGGHVQAFTRRTTTTFRLTVPAADLAAALHIEACRLRDVADREDEWRVERGAIEQEVARDESLAGVRVQDALVAAAFAGSPLAWNGVGTKDSFEHTDAATLRRFHEEYYVPGNAILVVAGDVDPAATIALVQSLMASIPARPLPPHLPPFTPPASGGPARVAGDFNAEALAYVLPGTRSPDYAAARILIDALNDPASALGSLFVRGRAGGTFADMIETLPDVSLALIGADAPNFQGGGIAPGLVQQIVDDYRSQGIPPKLVAAAQKREAVRLAQAWDTPEDLADEWTTAVAVEGYASPEDEANALAAVSVADVNRVARTYLDPARAFVAVAGPAKAEPFVPSLRARAGRGESFHPAGAPHVALPAWAAGLTDTAGIRTTLSRDVPVEMTLPNGLHLVVLRRPGSHTVTIRGRVRIVPGIEDPPGKDGLAAVTDGVFAYGTASEPAAAFAEAVDEIGGDEHAGADFGVSVLPEDFDRAMRLLAEHELHPLVTDRTLRLAKAAYLRDIIFDTGRAVNGLDLIFDAKLYPRGDPALRRPNVKTLAALTSADVRSFLTRAYRPDATTVAVVGDVSPDAVQQTVQRWFGSWTATGTRPRLALPPVALNKPALVSFGVVQPQELVAMRESIGLLADNPQRYALQLGIDILGGDAFASRLFTDLREERGLVYEVSAGVSLGRTRSSVSLQFACDPGMLKPALQIVQNDLAAMASNGPSQSELDEAKAFALRRLVVEWSDPSQAAMQLVDQAEQGLPADEVLRSAAALSAVRIEDVRDAFRRWIRPAGFVRVIFGPIIVK